MWPYSTSSSRVIGTPTKPKIHIDLDSFANNDKTIDATLTPDIWAMIEWLSATTDTAHIDVIRALLFQALYGHIAYALLIAHIEELQHDEDQDEEEDLKADELFALFAPIAKQEPKLQNLDLEKDQIRMSPSRATQADLKHVGKSNVHRKLQIPHRMWVDLDRQAAKANIDLAVYVRGLLFKTLQGEVNYNQWQQARSDLESKPNRS